MLSAFLDKYDCSAQTNIKTIKRLIYEKRAESLENDKSKRRCWMCTCCFKDLKSAVKQILFDINNNNLHKTILFSPSAASFDNFKNFEERGDYFSFLLKNYKSKKTLNVIK